MFPMVQWDKQGHSDSKFKLCKRKLSSLPNK